MIIEDSLVRGGVWYNIWKSDEFRTPITSQVFIASFFDALQDHHVAVNKELVEAIVSRENRQSTNLGNGIAIPHPGFDDLGEKSGTLLVHDTIYLAYPRFPMQWDEGAIIFAVFFICMSSKEKHLAALSELAKGLSKPGVMEILKNREPLDIVLPAISIKKA